MRAPTGATPEDLGLVSGLVNTTKQVGAALGLAVLANVSATHIEGLLADGERSASTLTSGYHLASPIAAGLVSPRSPSPPPPYDPTADRQRP